MKNWDYKPYGKIIARYPALPFKALLSALADESAFQSIIRSEWFEETLMYVSPDLCTEFTKYKEGKLNDKDSDRMERTLMKYLSRGCTRATPFASLAYCHVEDISDNDSLPEAYSGTPSLYFSYDMQLLYTIANTFIRPYIIKNENTEVRLNPTLLRIYNKWVFNLQKPNGVIKTEKVHHNRLLDFIARHMTGKMTISELKALILQNFETEYSVIDNFISSVIGYGFLLTDIEPNVIGTQYFNRLAKMSLYADDTTKEIFSELDNRLKLLNSTLSATKRIKEVGRLWNYVSSKGICVPKKSILHIDAHDYSDSTTNSKKIIDEIKGVHDLLCRVTPRYSNTRLSQFAKRFSDRYETQAVPLLEVFDSSIGIGYGDDLSSTVDPIARSVKTPPRGYGKIKSINLTPFQVMLLNRIALSNNLRKISIIDKDITPDMELRDSCNYGESISVMFRKLEYDGQQYIIDTPSFSGISGIKLAARFAHGNPAIKGFVDDIADIEQQHSPFPIAEISHYHSSHVGNISERPKFRNVTIDCLANVDEDSLPLSDLMIKVNFGRIELWSHRLESRIIPSLTTAHNYGMSQWSVYKFLCDLQSQGFDSGLSFSWGGLADVLNFTPRVTYGNVVLARACWRVNSADKTFGGRVTTQSLMSYADKRNMPRYVMFPEGDNDLFVDMKSAVSVDALVSALKGRNVFSLEEFFPTDDIADYSSVRIMEYIIPFIKNHRS